MEECFAKETDGFFARHFDRRISGAISRHLVRTPITPNQITAGVTLLGIGAGVWMAQPGYGPKLCGALLFLATSILDGCDGEVARAKKMTSQIGGWLDLWGDNVVHVAVFYGLGVGLFNDSDQAVYLLLGKAAVGGTLVSASLASWQTYRKLKSPSPLLPLPWGEVAKPAGDSPDVWRGGGEGGSLFTSVAGDARRVESSPWQKKLVQLADALARRDFIYGVVVLAWIGHLEWFLWARAVGVNLYAAVLLLLFLLG